jgi:hypothetical protein
VTEHYSRAQLAGKAAPASVSIVRRQRASNGRVAAGPAARRWIRTTSSGCDDDGGARPGCRGARLRALELVA